MICRIGYDCWATFKSILYRSSRWISSAGCLLHCCLHASQQHRVDCYCFFPSIYLFTGSRQSIDRSATESVVVYWIGNRWSVTDMNSEILPEWDEWWSRLKSSADYHVRTVDWWVSLQVCRYTEWMNGNGLMPDALAVESEKKMQEECFSDTQAQHQEKSSKCRALGRMEMEWNWIDDHVGQQRKYRWTAAVREILLIQKIPALRWGMCAAQVTWGGWGDEIECYSCE